LKVRFAWIDVEDLLPKTRVDVLHLSIPLFATKWHEAIMSQLAPA
jgi:hypothetical protein